MAVSCIPVSFPSRKLTCGYNITRCKHTRLSIVLAATLLLITAYESLYSRYLQGDEHYCISHLILDSAYFLVCQEWQTSYPYVEVTTTKRFFFMPQSGAWTDNICTYGTIQTKWVRVKVAYFRHLKFYHVHTNASWLPTLPNSVLVHQKEIQPKFKLKINPKCLFVPIISLKKKTANQFSKTSE